MARSPRTTASKARAGSKARRNTAPKAAAPSKKATAKRAPAKKASSKRTGSKAQAKRPQAQAENWAGSVGSLLTSQVGREVLAEVLEAAVSVLRRVRDTGQQIANTGGAAVDAGSSTVSSAVDVTTDVASGAIETGTEIASATADMMQTAVGTLANIATSGVRSLLPEASAEPEGTDGQKGRGKTRKGS
jgi:hypothetical protein